MKERNVLLSIIFTFITFGIYWIYWLIVLTSEVNEQQTSDYKTSGGMAFLFSLITLGIYGIYWAFKEGENYDALRRSASNSSVLFALLQIFGLNIINMVLLQLAMNDKISGRLS